MAQLRAAIGMTVHGNDDIARSVKYYMYNRFKSPQWDLAYGKTFTHVFFTRPDLNLLEDDSTISGQAAAHTETAMIWKRHPDLFKLLTDKNRCKDRDNFNLLLSNQISSFSLKDEEINTIKVGKSWNDHQIVYGSDYTGRTADSFTCTFTETKDFSVINLIKLWMTYIDNVSRGAFLPYYGKQGKANTLDPFCHVHTRTLDYAASCYFIITAENGEDILYWSKYYGIFPTSTGVSALSWDNDTPLGSAPKLNITFAYSYKLDLNPISLVEFNYNAGIGEDMTAISSYDAGLAHSARPLVATPYIEFEEAEPSITSNTTVSGRSIAGLKLKFKHDDPNRGPRSDKVLYKAKL